MPQLKPSGPQGEKNDRHEPNRKPRSLLNEPQPLLQVVAYEQDEPQ